jgi:hypothetical protein
MRQVNLFSFETDCLRCFIILMGSYWHTSSGHVLRKACLELGLLAQHEAHMVESPHPSPPLSLTLCQVSAVF